MSTHSLGVMCAECLSVLESDVCSCGGHHGFGHQLPSEWAAKTWPDHSCFQTQDTPPGGQS